jgi:hypothetical protein
LITSGTSFNADGFDPSSASDFFNFPFHTLKYLASSPCDRQYAAWL